MILLDLNEIIKESNTKTDDIQYWLKVEKDIMEWLKTNPDSKDIERLYKETPYEMIKMVCSGYRFENQK